MKRALLTLFAAVATLAAVAQSTTSIPTSPADVSGVSCTPDNQYNASPAGIYPANTAVLGGNTFTGALTIKTLSTFTVPAPPVTANVQGVRVVSITGAPNNFVLQANYTGTLGGQQCWVNGGTNPNFTPVLGCIGIFADATATQAAVGGGPNNNGVYPLSIVVEGYAAAPPFLPNFQWSSALNQTFTYNVTLTVTGCGFSLSTNSVTVSSSTTTASVNVTAGAGCNWSVQSNGCTFVSSFGPSSGTGNGTVSFTFPVNTTPNDRFCTFIIAGQGFTLTQQGVGQTCSYSLSDNAETVTNTAGTYNVSVSTDPTCAWTASSPCNWVTTSPASGTGNGQVALTYLANTTSQSRTCTLTIAGQPFVLTQNGVPCTYSFPQGQLTVGSNANSPTIPFITNLSTCAWTSQSSCTWLTTNPTSGTGSISLAIVHEANPLPIARTCTLTVGGATLVVTQQASGGCIYQLSSSSESIPATGEILNPILLTTPNCTWTATSPCAWATVSPTSGTGIDTLAVTCQPNPTNVARTCTLTIGGQPYVVTQAAGQGGEVLTLGFTMPPTYNGLCPTPNLTFTNTSEGSQGIAGCAWGVLSSTGSLITTSTDLNLVYSFAQSDTYFIGLVCQGNGGLQDTLLQQYTVNCTNSIAEDPANAIIVAPNPANTTLNVLFAKTQPMVTATVVNTLGQTVLTTKGQGAGLTLNVESLPTGVYTLVLQGNNFSTARRVVKE